MNLKESLRPVLPGVRNSKSYAVPITGIVLSAVALLLVAGVIFVLAAAYSRASMVEVSVDDGRTVGTVETKGKTINDMVYSGEVSLGPFDTITPALNTRLYSGMQILIQRAKVLFITSGGTTRQVYLTGGTVADALDHANVEYDADDIVTPALTEKIVPGMRIKHVALDTQIVQEYYYIPYETITKQSNTLNKGEYKVDTRGVNGIRTREIMVSYQDGVEVGRTQVSEVITRQPVNKVILEGTYVAPTPTPKPTKSPEPEKTKDSKPSSSPSPKRTSSPDSSRTSSPSPSRTSSPSPSRTSSPSSTPKPTKKNGGIYDDIDPEDLKIPSKPTEFEEVLTMEVTAYTHTGRQAAIGVWPRYTRSYDNPGTVAIDTSVLKYNTLLYITGYGYAITEDCGVRGMQLDVFMNTEAECVKWGRRRNVEIYVIGPRKRS